MSKFKKGDKVNVYFDLTGWTKNVYTIHCVAGGSYPYVLVETDGIWSEDHLRLAKPTSTSYEENIIKLLKRQREKGLHKYGETLEQNVTLSIEQRVEHLEEELIDGLEYCEHIKAVLTDDLTVNDYARMAMRTAGEYDSWYDKMKNAVYGLNGEAGECIDIMKKYEFQGHDFDREHMIEELGDVAWYLPLAADALGVTLEEILLRNIEKLKSRYPDGFDKARSINRES